MYTPKAPARRIQLGAALRTLRQAKGMTTTEAAAALLVSQPKISNIENGRRRISPRDVRDLCKIYGEQDPRTVHALIRMAG